MTYSQIRINKTKEMQKVFDLLRKRFALMSESDIVKMLLSDAYHKYKTEAELDYSDATPKELLNNASHLFEVGKNSLDDDNIASSTKTKPLDFSTYA